MVPQTRLSDFHKMYVTVMEKYYSKQKSTIIHYRKFKDLNNEAFIKDLNAPLSKSIHEEIFPFEALRKSVNVALERHAPIKTRHSTANQAPYVNKKLTKEIMKRYRLTNKFLNTRSDHDIKAYKPQRNYDVSFLRKAEKKGILWQC